MPKETMVERMRHQQSIGKYAEKMDEFAPGIDVEVAMSKDFRKRPGTERGEDMFVADMETGLTGVFDGLGQGREGGTEQGRGADASETAAFAAPSLYTVLRKNIEASKGVAIGIKEAAREQSALEHPSVAGKMAAGLAAEWLALDPAVQKEILTIQQTVKKLSERVKDTGGLSTATLGKTVELPNGRKFEVIANVGDSGVMRVDADGLADLVTKPDSVLDFLLSKGIITPDQAKDPSFRVEKMGGKTVKNLKTAMYQALGNPDTPVIPRITVIELKPGDEISYFTDGVIDEFMDADGDFDTGRAAEILSKKGATAETLVDAAAKEGGADKQDEKTVLRKRLAIEIDPGEIVS